MESQTRIYLEVMLALPLIAVRLLYSLISDFGNNSQFSLLGGNETIRLFMASIEEFLVVIMYAILGVMTPRLTSTQPVGSTREEYSQEANSYTAAYGPGARDVEGSRQKRTHSRHHR